VGHRGASRQNRRGEGRRSPLHDAGRRSLPGAGQGRFDAGPKATVWMRAVKPALRSWAGRARAAESTAGARAALARAGVPKGARSPRSPGLPFSRRGVTLRGLGVAIERRGVEIVGARATRARAAEATVTTRAARARAAEATAGARAARARAGVPKGARARKAAVTTRAAGARAAESTAGARAAWARAE
jgi:hypothetical protein